METFIVVVRRGDGNWSANIGENEPRTFAECEQDVEGLATIAEFADAEMRIISTESKLATMLVE